MPILLYCGHFEVHFDGFSVFLGHNEHPKQHEILLMPFRSPGVEESDSDIFDLFFGFFPLFLEDFFFFGTFLGAIFQKIEKSWRAILEVQNLKKFQNR